DLLAKESGDATANRTRTSLSAFFSWAIREGFELPQGNVASNTNRRPQTARDRVLRPAEIKAVWNACRNDDYGAVLKLLLVTGCRANEIARLRRDEIFDDRIELPPQRTKNGRQHVVPLSSPAKSILSARPAAGDAACVFGRDGTGFNGWGQAKARAGGP